MGEDRFTQRTVTVVMSVIALLAFVFSFGNVWALALRLGVARPVAPLVAPMVDLSVVGLLVALRYLSLRGVPAGELKAGTRLMHLCGLLTLGLNIAEPLLLHLWGRAAVDAVAPILLLGWGQVGPQFLRQFHHLTTPAPADTPAPAPILNPVPASTLEAVTTPLDPPAPVPAPVRLAEPAPADLVAPEPELLAVAPPVTVTKTPVTANRPPVPEALLNVARRIAEKHHEDQGEPITPGQLKTRLGVTLPLATAALEQLSV